MYWVCMLCLNWNRLLHVLTVSDCTVDVALKNIFSGYQDVFKDELGTLKNLQVTIPTDPSAKPKLYRAHPVPYALKTKVGDELTCLVKLGIYKPIPTSQWAAPTLTVLRSDGCIHLCGDYRQTPNKVASCDKYPVPKTDDIFSNNKLGNKVRFLISLSAVSINSRIKKFTDCIKTSFAYYSRKWAS